jgi:hypothetical protein
MNATVTNLAQALNEINDLLVHVRSVTFPGRYRLSFTKIKERRSLSQNNTLWMWETHISNELGWSKEEVHEYNIEHFAQRKEVKLPNGIVAMIPMRTSDKEMDSARMSFYMNQIQIFWNQQGVTLPDPEDYKAKEMFDFYEEKGML